MNTSIEHNFDLNGEYNEFVQCICTDHIFADRIRANYINSIFEVIDEHNNTT